MRREVEIIAENGRTNKNKATLDKQYQSWGFVSLVQPCSKPRGGRNTMNDSVQPTKSCSKFARIIIIVATPFACTWDIFM